MIIYNANLKANEFFSQKCNILGKIPFTSWKTLENAITSPRIRL